MMIYKIIIIVCFLLCVVDICLGQPLYLIFKEFFYSENYASAREKRADPDRYKLMEEREIVYSSYKENLKAALKYQGINTYLAMKKARAQYDYKSLYNIYLDISCSINGDDWENYKDDMI